MREASYGERRVSIELTNICNLHCNYCLRDEDALYHTPANFFPIDLLQRVAREARDEIGVTHIVFTGGEPTLHPHFKDIIATIADQELTTSFVTNGWHFDRVWQALQAHRASVKHVSFSLDGSTREAHDRWRGEGSFVRLVRAFARCRTAGLPFVIKVGIRRDTVPQLEQIAIFAARMGASTLSFGHMLPTSGKFDEQLAMGAEERRIADQEIAMLARIFKMKIGIDVGYYNLDPAAPCSALASRSCNIDYRGRLSLCCNLSGFRGAVGEADVVADLKTEGFASAYARLRRVADDQLKRRSEALADHEASGGKPDLYLGSPCLFCLQSFGKVPWHDSHRATGARRMLPVVQ